MKKYKYIALTVVTSITLLLAGCTSKTKEESISKATFQALPAESSTLESLPADTRLLDALGENQDASVWITIPNTDIDALVVQSEDNDYYLRRDIDRNYSIDGSYFADFENTLNSTSDMSRNVIIYGHYFTERPDLYFGGLWNLANDADLAKENRTIYLSLPDKKLEYEIVSIGIANAKTDTLALTANPSKGELAQILESARERSIYDFDFKINEVENILTLSTCSDNPSERLVVVAILKTEL